MHYRLLRAAVCRANRDLLARGLIVQTWGNVSACDRHAGVFAIKPSGVPYDSLTPLKIVVLNFDGKKIAGDLNPSSDASTHAVLYKWSADVNAIVHIHSPYTVAFAQALRSIPCYGTTHADVFFGEIPVTAPLTRVRVASDYEKNVGRSIVELFTKRQLQPSLMKAALVAGHGPFIWGKDVGEAVDNAEILEQVAHIAFLTELLNRRVKHLPAHLLAKHFLRKHGRGAYYGQICKESK